MTLFPKWLILSLCIVNVCLVVTELFKHGQKSAWRAFLQADYSFSQSSHCSLPSDGTFPTLFSDSDRHLPATVCLDLTNSPQFLFDKRRRLVAKQELIANVAEYEQDLASEKKPGMEKVSQGNNLLCKVLSVSVKLETDLAQLLLSVP